MNYSELLQLTKGWGNFISDRRIIWRLLNFFENPDYASVFAGSLEVDNIIMMLSALLGKNAVFEAGETV